MRVPSGDQRGLLSFSAPLVSCLASLPSAFTRQMCERVLFSFQLASLRT